MSSAEELTFVVGRWLYPLAVMLDVVRRIRPAPTSSCEQAGTVFETLIRTLFVRSAFRTLRRRRLPSHFETDDVGNPLEKSLGSDRRSLRKDLK